MKGALVAVLVGFALLAGTTARADGAAQPRVGMLGAVRHAHVSHSSRTLAVVHASAGTCSGSPCTAYEAAINRYFTDVAAASGTTTNVYSVATQYYDSTTTHIAYGSRFGGSYVDTSAFPASGCNDGTDPICLTDAQLQAEMQKVITRENWPTGQGSLFFLVTPDTVGVCYYGGGVTGNDCTTNSFCAYHSGFYDGNGQPVVYAVQPYVGTIQGCNELPASPNGSAVDSALNTISHEQNEAITDPWNDGTPGSGGWLSADANADEIGDLCAWSFGTMLGAGTYNQLINGHEYTLQQEYSNQDLGCVQHLGGTPTLPPVGNGTPPLIYKGGWLMLTNTAYTIFWIPGNTPTNTAAPVVSGVAAVGKLLTTSSGTWSGSPTGYTYRWQRCAADGTGCTDISGASAATYRLTTAEAGHTVRSEVSAKNAGGASAFTASVPTEVVVPLPTASHVPVVSGVAAVGKTLSTTDGTWNTPASSLAYRWLRCSSSGGACSTIAGATVSTYVLAAADAGHTVEASVSATNAAGTTTAVSVRTAVVLGRPTARKAPRITGRSKAGKRLIATHGLWTWTPSAYRFQWFRCSKHGGSCRRIARATHAVYRITKRDAGHRLRVKVTAVNAAGSTSSSSGASRIVKR